MCVGRGVFETVEAFDDIYMTYVGYDIQSHMHVTSYNSPSASFGPCRWYDSKQALHQTGFHSVTGYMLTVH